MYYFCTSLPYLTFIVVAEESQLEHSAVTTSLPLKTLTSYIQQLRTFLPEAAPITARRDEGKQEGAEEEGLHNDFKERVDYVTGFIDKALMTDWDKLDTKVRYCYGKLHTH